MSEDYPLIIRTTFEAGEECLPEHARAKYDCENCGFTYYKDELRMDGERPGLLVCKECWDKKQPEPQPTGVEDS